MRPTAGEGIGLGLCTVFGIVIRAWRSDAAEVPFAPMRARSQVQTALHVLPAMFSSILLSIGLSGAHAAPTRRNNANYPTLCNLAQLPDFGAAIVGLRKFPVWSRLIYR